MDINEVKGDCSEKIVHKEFDQKNASVFFNKIGLIFLAGSIMSMGTQLLAKYMITKISPETLYSMDEMAVFLMAPVYFIVYPLFIFVISRIPVEEKPVKNNITAGQYFAAFLMSYAILYFSNLAGTLLALPKTLINHDSMINPLFDLAVDGNTWVQIVFMVLIAPVFEELIFRKFLVDRVVKYGEGTAVVLSGIMFALFHGNVSQGVYAFSLGMFFAFIYLRTRNVLYTMGLHIFINLMGSVVSSGVLKLLKLSELSGVLALDDMGVLYSYLSSNVMSIVIYFLYDVLILGMMVSGMILLIRKRKQFKVRKLEGSIPKGLRFKTVFLNAGMILFSLLWIGMGILSYIFD